MQPEIHAPLGACTGRCELVRYFSILVLVRCEIFRFSPEIFKFQPVLVRGSLDTTVKGLTSLPLCVSPRKLRAVTNIPETNNWTIRADIYILNYKKRYGFSKVRL